MTTSDSGSCLHLPLYPVVQRSRVRTAHVRLIMYSFICMFLTFSLIEGGRRPRAPPIFYRNRYTKTYAATKHFRSMRIRVSPVFVNFFECTDVWKCAALIGYQLSQNGISLAKMRSVTDPMRTATKFYMRRRHRTNRTDCMKCTEFVPGNPVSEITSSHVLLRTVV